jgi:hypothetical protein
LEDVTSAMSKASDRKVIVRRRTTGEAEQTLAGSDVPLSLSFEICKLAKGNE